MTYTWTILDAVAHEVHGRGVRLLLLLLRRGRRARHVDGPSPRTRQGRREDEEDDEQVRDVREGRQIRLDVTLPLLADALHLLRGDGLGELRDRGLELDVPLLDLLLEHVVGDDARDRDDEARGRRDQRLRDAARDRARIESGRLGHHGERVDHARHGAAHADQRRDGRDEHHRAEALLEDGHRLRRVVLHRLRDAGLDLGAVGLGRELRGTRIQPDRPAVLLAGEVRHPGEEVPLGVSCGMHAEENLFHARYYSKLLRDYFIKVVRSSSACAKMFASVFRRRLLK